MKKSLLLLVLSLILAGISGAQPTIGTAQLPVAGLAWTTANDTDYVAAIPPGGANVTWDYTGLLNQYLDTLGFASATGTPYAGTFSGSNLAAYDAPNLTWGYYTTNSTGFYSDGFVDANGSVFEFNPSNLFVPIPFTYGNTRTSTTGFTIDTLFNGQNIRFEFDINTDFLADGYGTLLLPTGTINDVLRIKSTDLSTTTISVELFPGTGIYTPVQTTLSQTTSFRYFDQSQASFILDISADSLGTTANSSSYLVQSVILDAPTIGQTVSTPPYPNPADKVIHLPNIDVNADEITVWSLDGKTILAPLQGSSADRWVDTSKLNDGLYFFRSGNRFGKFVVRH